MNKKNGQNTKYSMLEANQCNTRANKDIKEVKNWINCPFCSHSHPFPLKGGCPLIEAKILPLTKDINHYKRWVDVVNAMALTDEEFDEQ